MPEQYITPERGQIEYIIGIDFGHGETSAAICRIDNNKDPEDIVFAGRDIYTIPSTMYIETSADGMEQTFIGKYAVKVYERGGSGDFHAYFKQSPNVLLDESNEVSIQLMKAFMKKVYETICTLRAGELMEGGIIKRNHVVFIACPSQSQNWDDIAMQNYVQLALEAGLPIAGATIDDKFKLSGIVRESRAAYIRALQKEEVLQKASQGILVIDYGSSTIDITYYREGENPVDKGYSTLGASNVEECILKYLQEYHSELGGDQNPQTLKLLDEVYPNLKTGCLYTIREAKEKFYTELAYNVDNVEVRYKFRPRIDADMIDVAISKDIISNHILNEYISDVKSALEDFKRDVIGNNPVTLLVLTGGASAMDFVQEIAQSVFGNDILILPPQNASLTVSNGIATAGRADVKLYWLANDLISHDLSQTELDSIYKNIRYSTTRKITNFILDKAHKVFLSFRDGYINNYAGLRHTLMGEINTLTSYNDKLYEAFDLEIQDYIFKNIIPQIKERVCAEFPTYNVSNIGKTDFHIDTKISFPINSHAFDILIGRAAIDYSDGLLYVILQIIREIIGDNVIFSGFVDAVEMVIESRTLSDSVRMRIYNRYMSDDYCRKKLEREVIAKIPDFKKECDVAATNIIQQYIVSEMNKIQSQIK